MYCILTTDRRPTSHLEKFKWPYLLKESSSNLLHVCRGVARISVLGGTGRAPNARDDRGAEGAEGVECGEGVSPSPLGMGSGEGASCAPSPEKFLNFYIKKVSSGAFWVARSYRLAACFI